MTIRLIIQAAIILYGLYVGYTRIDDYYHHWTDVFVGFALGMLIAYLIEKEMKKKKRDLGDSDSWDIPRTETKVKTVQQTANSQP